MGIVVVVGLVWWGVSKNSGSGNVIKIGFIGPLTGDAAAYGESAQNIVQLAVSDINAAGGVSGKQVQVIYEDGACNGTTAADAMQKLANVDGVQAILGGYCSAESFAARSYRNPKQGYDGLALFQPETYRCESLFRPRLSER